MTTLTILRALHMIGLVWWIGGVALATCVILPMANRLPAAERFQRIKQFEQRFATQARIAVLIVGITGLWMLAKLGGMSRLASPGAWWLVAGLDDPGVVALCLSPVCSGTFLDCLGKSA